MSAQDWWRTEPDVGKSGRTEPVAAPEAKIGSWWLTMHAPTPIRCKGYSMWPGTKPIGTYWRTIDARTHIGPVTTVKVGTTYATIFVRGCWINVWKKDTEKTKKKQDWVFFLRFRCPRKKCVVGETVAGTTSLDVMRTFLLDEMHQAKVAL